MTSYIDLERHMDDLPNKTYDPGMHWVGSRRCGNCKHHELSSLEQPCMGCIVKDDLYTLWEAKK
jgi:hypothetical protein